MSTTIEIKEKQAEMQSIFDGPRATASDQALFDDLIGKGSEPREWSPSTVESMHGLCQVYAMGYRAAAQREASTEPSAAYLTACKMGNMLFNLAQVDDMPDPWRSKAREMVTEWDANRKAALGADALTDDAKRLDYVLAYGRPMKWFDDDNRDVWRYARINAWSSSPRGAIDAAIEAHTKAGSGK